LTLFKIQEPLTQDAKFLRVVGVNIGTIIMQKVIAWELKVDRY